YDPSYGQLYGPNPMVKRNANLLAFQNSALDYVGEGVPNNMNMLVVRQIEPSCLAYGATAPSDAIRSRWASLSKSSNVCGAAPLQTRRAVATRPSVRSSSVPG